MRIGKSEYYAIIFINALKNSEKQSLSDITNRYKIPEDFLYKIALKLKKYGIVESKEGVNGGYRLAKPFEAITLYDIITSFKNDSIDCCVCDNENECTKHEFCEEYSRINSDLDKKLREINISDS